MSTPVPAPNGIAVARGFDADPHGAPAYQLNGRAIDRARFYAVACDPRRSVAVEACAGAGKTWMLVSRMARALLTGTAPHEILAITFTRKAAGEMRQRLDSWLAEWAAASPAQQAAALVARGLAPDEAERLAPALGALHAAVLTDGRGVQIRTFHSWFAALLRNAPLAVLQQLRLPAHFDLQEDDAQAVARVWRRFHVAVAADAQLRADYQASVTAYGRSNTQKALAAALARRVEFTLADGQGVVEASVRDMAAQFPDFAAARTPEGLLALQAVRQPLEDAALALGRASQPSFAQQGAALRAALDAGALDAVRIALFTQSGDARKFSDKLAGLESVRAAQDVVARLVAANIQHEAWLHHQRMVRLTRRLIAEYAELKREHGWIDMNDVERTALILLADPVLAGFVQERLDQRVRQLLIDEFQDTNPLQWQALHAWLSSYAGAGGAAPGVFIVGDPKQSIYRFRRAEPQVFRAAQRFVVDALGGDQLACDHTHRNAPALLRVVNAVMGQAQTAEQYDGMRPHTTESTAPGGVGLLPPIARAARPAGAPAAASVWRDSLRTPRELPQERLATLECRQAARWIAQQLAEGVRPADIMVLARRRERLAEMEEQLRALHIPTQQPEKADLSVAAEVQDIVALLDVLVSPGHDLALARVLKSPLFGLDDDALVELAVAARAARAAAAEGQQPASPRWFQLLQTDAGLRPPLREAGSLLRDWQTAVQTLPPHDALQRIYGEGDLLARFAAAAPAPARATVLANLRALPGVALQLQGGRYLTPYALVRALKAGGITGPVVALDHVVRLLTVHGAKGLEAPVVLMLDTDGAAGRAETMGVVCDWPGEAPTPRRFAFIASESRPPPCCEQALEAEQRARAREELNALYVAMTRSAQRLILSSVEPARPVPDSWWCRLQAWAKPLEPEAAGVGPGAETAAAASAGLVAAGSAPDEAFDLPVLPALPAQWAGPTPATEFTRYGLDGVPEPLTPEDGARTRFGQAVHRLLELWRHGDTGFSEARLRRIRREFALDAETLAAAAAMALRIRHGEGAWAWDPAVVDWHANEAELLLGGERLRIDRLVRHRDSGHWWVLDYKAEASPQDRPTLCAQMQRYRDAVALARPGDAVRVAFLTGTGRLVELP